MSVEERLARLERRLAEQVRVGELVELTDGGQRGTYGIRSLSANYPDLGASPTELVPGCILTEPRYGATNLVQTMPTVRSGDSPGELALLIQPGLLPSITIAVRALRAIPYGGTPEVDAAVFEYISAPTDRAAHDVTIRAADGGDAFGWRMTPFGPYLTMPNSHPERYGEVETFPLPIINPRAIVDAHVEDRVKWLIPGLGRIPFTGSVTGEYHFDGVKLDDDDTIPLMMRSRAFGIQNVTATPAGSWTPALPAADTINADIGTDVQDTTFAGVVNAAAVRLEWDVVSPDTGCEVLVLSHAAGGLQPYPRTVDTARATPGTGSPTATAAFSLAGPLDEQNRKRYRADAIPLDVGLNSVIVQTAGQFGEGRVYTFNILRES